MEHWCRPIKLSPAVDSDGDGIKDAWELAHFSNITAANATTDTDHDGTSDVAEALAGTDPRQPASAFTVSQVSTDTDGNLIVQWPGVVGNTYTLLTSTTLAANDWIPIATGIPGTAPTCSYSVRMNTARGFLRVQLDAP